MNLHLWSKKVYFAASMMAVFTALSADNTKCEPPRDALAQTPPLGWNSFDSYGVYLHEEAAYANLEAMAEKLKPHGYEYFVIDNGWFGEYRLQEGTHFPAEKHAHDIRIDEHGHYLPSKVYFPNGLEGIAKRCKELGLKLGVHLMRGIPRKAYELNLPIQGTPYTARDIADTDPEKNCNWCTYNYAVDMSKPGAQEWYDGLIQHIADMGVEMIKYDDIVPYPEEVKAVAKAIKKTGKPILLSLSPGNDVDPEALGVFKLANMLRVTKDVWDEQEYIDECFKAWRKWQGKEQPGFWIDMDMIPFGQLQLMSPDGDNPEYANLTNGDIALAGKGVNRWSQLTKPQMRTFITMRALAASPLMMGGDLPSLDDYSLKLITDPDMLACNQNGIMGSLVYEQDGFETWITHKKESDQAGWIGIFNRTESVKSIEISEAVTGLKDLPSYSMRDIWNERVVEPEESIEIQPNGVLFMAFDKAKDVPNIIYILADDLGYGDLSFLGQKNFETPHIDKLADQGMVFTDHYSGSTVCAPSRASLLTGLHTGHAPVRGNLEVQPEGQYPMPEDTFVIPQMLKQAGYTSGLFGKWGLGAPGTSSEPLKMGFDRFYGYNCQRMAHHYYPYFLWDDDRREVLWGNFGLEEGTYAPDLIHKETLEFIEENKDRPFFCYYAIIQPHAEMFAQERYMEKYRGKFLPESAYAGTDGGPEFRKGPYGSQPEAHAAFAGMVNSIDDYVGDIVSKLEELGIRDNTLIIFTSDNGPHTEGGHEPAYFDSNGPFRGTKRDLYEGGIRVPMIASWPDVVEAGSSTDHVSAFWDVFPTLADITGQPLPGPIDGISLLPTLRGEKGQRKHEFLYWEFHELKGRQAIRKGKWKGVRYDVSIDPDSPIELYDLRVDPGETQNVADQFPQVTAELTELLQDARTTHTNPNFNFPDRR